MNNENKVRIRTALVMVYVSIITLLFGINSEAHAQMKEMIVYNKNILYIILFQFFIILFTFLDSGDSISGL